MKVARVHMISLAAEAERRGAAAQLLAQMPWPSTLHDARDCRTPEGLAATLKTIAVSDRTEDVPAGYRPKWRGPLSPGEVGCHASHREVWAEIAKADPAEGMHIVFEDDIAVADVQQLKAFFDQLEGQPELVYLGYERHEPEKRPTGWAIVALAGRLAMAVASRAMPAKFRGDIRGELLAKRYPKRTAGGMWTAGLHDGTWGYAVNAAGASKLLALGEPMCLRSDELMNFAIATDQIRALTPPTKLVVPREDVASTLFDDRSFRTYTQ
jgi:hypothetical protein